MSTKTDETDNVGSNAGVRNCEMADGDIVFYLPGNGAAFIRADPESVIELEGAWSL